MAGRTASRAIIPLDLPGVSRGKPLDKIGQRALPQGEIYFDNVRIPKRFAIALRDEYYGNVASAWSFAGTHMGQMFTGVARAAFEMALQYCHERKQGGQRLIDHQLTRYRIGDMMRRVELCRAVARRSLAYARLTPSGHPVGHRIGQGHGHRGSREHRRPRHFGCSAAMARRASTRSRNWCAMSARR